MRLIVTGLLAAAAFLAHAAEFTPYGQPFADGTAVPVSEAIAGFDAHAGKAGLYSGRITKVCQAMGCWMMLEHEGQAARVMFGEDDFFIPKDSTGTAVVHGVLGRKELIPAQMEHLSRDGKDATVEAVEYRIVADGVRLSAS